MRLLVVLFAVLLSLAGCGSSDSSDLAVTLYSIDGPAMSGAGYSLGEELGVYDPAKDYESEQLFNGYLILGEVDLTGAEVAKRLVDILEDRIADEQGLIAGCFVPRHGLRVTRDGVTTDYLICFECTNFEWYEGGSEDRVGTQSISDKHFAAFTKPLSDAGVELAPDF